MFTAVTKHRHRDARLHYPSGSCFLLEAAQQLCRVVRLFQRRDGELVPIPRPGTQSWESLGVFEEC